MSYLSCWYLIQGQDDVHSHTFIPGFFASGWQCPIQLRLLSSAVSPEIGKCCLQKIHYFRRARGDFCARSSHIHTQLLLCLAVSFFGSSLFVLVRWPCLVNWDTRRFYDAFGNLEMTLSGLDFVKKSFCLFCCSLAWVQGDFVVTVWP